MNALRKLSVFFLFVMLFTVVAVALFGTKFTDKLFGNNPRAVFTAAAVTDETTQSSPTVYALNSEKLPKILAIRDGEVVTEHSPYDSLPKGFEITDLFVSRNNLILLSGVEHVASETYISLYVQTYDVDKKREVFSPVLRELAVGETALERVANTRISSISDYGSVLSFFLYNNGEVTTYTYTTENPFALVAGNKLTVETSAPYGFVDRNDTVYFVGNGIVAYPSASSAPRAILDGVAFTKPVQYGNGFSFTDGTSGSAYLFDASSNTIESLSDIAETSGYMRFASYTPQATLTIHRTGELFVRWANDAEITNCSALVPTGKAGAIAGIVAIVLVIVILSYTLTYFICEARKLHFPVLWRSLLITALFAFIAATAVTRLFVTPRYTQRSLNSIRSYIEDINRTELDLNGNLPLLSGLPEWQLGIDGGLHRIYTADGSNLIVGTTDYRFRPGADGYYRAGTPGVLDALVAPGVDLTQANTVEVSAAAAEQHLVVVPSKTGSLIGTVDGAALERHIAAQVRDVIPFIYGGVAAIILITFAVMAGMISKIRRITNAVVLLANGKPELLPTQGFADEVGALTASVNNLSKSVAAQSESLRLQGSTYVKFIPSRIISLLGVDSIGEIDNSATAESVMVTMVVRFDFPERRANRTPRELFSSINEITRRASEIVGRWNGTICNFSHNEYDAVFENVNDAVNAAVAIRRNMDAQNAARAERGVKPANLQIGLDKSSVTMGIVGDDNHFVPTAVSSGLNTSRVLTGIGYRLDAGILCTEEVITDAGDFSSRYIGKAQQNDTLIRVYELFDGDAHDAIIGKQQTAAQFADGLYSLYSRDFAAAKRLFMDIARRHPDDGVNRFCLYLADSCEANPDEEIVLNKGGGR